ncbi:MAG: DJ-1/PfpI family protein [Candidatus Omnitrophota bacterium]
MSKKILMIIAKDGFRDEELFEPKSVFEKAGYKVIVASSSAGIATGKLGAKVMVDETIDKVDAQGYDAVVFVGGPGAAEYFKNLTAHSIAKKVNEQRKLLCAICVAPVILAEAGILKGKRATVWVSDAASIKAKGADYAGEGVVVDGNIITASGPSFAKEFGERIVEKLKIKN